MSTTVETLISQIATLVQEDGSNYGYTDWAHGLWTVQEIIGYINVIQKDFVLRSQIIKLIAAVQSVAGTRQYADPSYTMQIDRIAFSNTPTYRTTKFMLDRGNPAWRTLNGLPKQYHQDMLPTKNFEMDRAPTSVMTGAGYFPVGLLGTVRFMISNVTTATDATMGATSATLNSASSNFTVADVGKYISVAGAGASGGALITTIAARVSSTQITLSASSVGAVSGVHAAWGTTPYTPTGLYGVPRYFFGTRARNGILPHDHPYAGTVRQMLSGLTNFEVLATRLMDDIAQPTDLMRVPDFCLLYIKLGVLEKMLRKEGEGQDLMRAQYCEKRYSQGVQFFNRLMSATNQPVAQPTGS